MPHLTYPIVFVGPPFHCFLLVSEGRHTLTCPAPRSSTRLTISSAQHHDGKTLGQWVVPTGTPTPACNLHFSTQTSAIPPTNSMLPHAQLCFVCACPMSQRKSVRVCTNLHMQCGLGWPSDQRNTFELRWPLNVWTRIPIWLLHNFEYHHHSWS